MLLGILAAYLLYVLPIVTAYKMCKQKNRDPAIGVLLAIFFGWLAVLALHIFLKSRNFEYGTLTPIEVQVKDTKETTVIGLSKKKDKSKQEKMGIFCTNCGTSVVGHGKFCIKCGKALQIELHQNTQPHNDNSVPKVNQPSRKTVMQWLFEPIDHDMQK